jgi:HlyD family secretion protein
MKIRHLVLPALSVAGMAFAVVTVRDLTKPPVDPPLAVVPARSPFAKTLAGSGFVEPNSLFVDVAALRAGVVVEVLAEVGREVKRGDVLFKLDPRPAAAALAARRADVKTKAAELATREADVLRATAAVVDARARLDRLKATPRPEEVPPVAARLAEAERLVADDEDRLSRAESLFKSNAVMERDVVAARNALEAKRAARDKARADLDLLKAGAWRPDVAVSEAAVASALETESAARKTVEAARAGVDAAEAVAEAAAIEVELLTVRAPLDATVLQCEIRAGEFVGSERSNAPAPVILGALSPLHVRVDLDENDAGLYRPGAAAKAFVRGRGGAERPIPLTFVRVEPYVVPKKALTGSVQERVDVRVLQLIYKVDALPADYALYCGQQLDVFIDDATAP